MALSGLSKPLSPIDEQNSTIQVIREVYEGDEQETFETELEKALESKVNYIIIEPQRLGDETARWITVGNCLHKTAVISGIASIVCGSVWPNRPVFSSPLCAVSIFCAGLYTVSWNVDYCCQYQVERDSKKISKITNTHNFASPIVLVYTKNTRMKYLHRSVTLLASAFCLWRLYEIYK